MIRADFSYFSNNINPNSESIGASPVAQHKRRHFLKVIFSVIRHRSIGYTYIIGKKVVTNATTARKKQQTHFNVTYVSHSQVSPHLVLFSRSPSKPHSIQQFCCLFAIERRLRPYTYTPATTNTERTKCVFRCLGVRARTRIPDWMTMNIYMFTFSTSSFLEFLVTFSIQCALC